MPTDKLAIQQLRWAVLALGALYVFGLLLAWQMAPLAGTESGTPWLYAFNLFFYQNEPPVLVLSLSYLVGLYLWLSRQLPPLPAESVARPYRGVVGGVALAVLVGTTVGTLTISHGYPRTLDEFMVRWQARAFSMGTIEVPLPEDLVPYERALRTPIFVHYDDSAKVWTSGYLPGYAALYAVFAVFDAGMLLNPVLAALSVLLTAALARNFWPHESGAPVLAALLLASSAQFLCNAMTFYSMPAHLCLSLAWLWLYLRNDWWVVLLPLVGVLALGLHQPVMHMLFVLPFLVRMLFTRRWQVTLYTAAVYLAGCAVWLVWYKIHRAGASSQPGTTGLTLTNLSGIFHLDRPRSVAQILSLNELCSWQNAAAVLLALVAYQRFLRLSPFQRDLGWSLALSYLFYFFAPDQGHGWGDRYAHAALGNLVLLAVTASYALADSGWGKVVRRLVASATCFAVLIQLPVRAWEIEKFARPLVRVMDYIDRQPADVVVVRPLEVWYGIDLLRNDPFLRNRPLVMNNLELTDEQLQELQRHFSVRFLRTEDFLELGLLRHPRAAEDGARPDREK